MLHDCWSYTNNFRLIEKLKCSTFRQYNRIESNRVDSRRMNRPKSTINVKKTDQVNRESLYRIPRVAANVT